MALTLRCLEAIVHNRPYFEALFNLVKVHPDDEVKENILWLISSMLEES
jgi:hypothetical protein